MYLRWSVFAFDCAVASLSTTAGAQPHCNLLLTAEPFATVYLPARMLHRLSIDTSE